MKICHLLLALVVISACASVTVKAENSLYDTIYGIFKTQIEKKINEYMESNDPTSLNKMQLKFIQQFLRSIILGEIKLYDWALHQKNQLSAKELQDIKTEVDALVETLFQGKYTTLQKLIDEIKKENPKELENIFSEDTFNEDILKYENQEKLVTAIINKLFQGNNSENLVDSLKDLDQIKKFLIKYKGVSESDLEQSIAYLKDAKKIKQSLDNLVKKLSDPAVRSKLISLVYKLASIQSSGDLFEILYADPELASILLDNDWQSLMKIKDQIYAVGGKAYEEYQKRKAEEEKQKEKQKEEEGDDENDDEDDEKDSSSSLSFGKIVLILACIAFLIGLVFVGMRKYRQSKASGTSAVFQDERYYVNTTL